MDIHYKVPKQIYIELLAEMIRTNERRPIRVLTTLLLTVGQMAIIMGLCVFKVEQASHKTFLLIWSLLLAGLTVLRRCTTRQRAAGTLRRLEYTKQLPQDYWQEHKLYRKGQALVLQYGELELTCPISGISRIEETPHALYLYCEQTIFDIVPVSAFANVQQMQSFIRTLRNLAGQAQDQTNVRDIVKDRLQSDSANAGLHWEMDEKTFLDGQYIAYHTLFYRYRFLRPATFVRLAVSVFAVVSFMQSAAVTNRIFCAVLLLLANLENISMIPAVCRLRIRREVGAWQGGTAYRLALQKDILIYASEQAQVNIPISKINLCEKRGAYFIIAWKDFPAVIIPEAICQQPEAVDLLAQITSHNQ